MVPPPRGARGKSPPRNIVSSGADMSWMMQTSGVGSRVIGLVSSRSKHTVRTRLCSGFVQPGCLCAALRPSGRSRLFLRHTYSIVSQRYLILLTLWGVFGYRERVDLTTFTETLRRIMKNSLCQTPNRDATNSSSLGLGRGGLAHQRKHRWKRRGSLGPYPLH